MFFLGPLSHLGNWRAYHTPTLHATNFISLELRTNPRDNCLVSVPRASCYSIKMNGKGMVRLGLEELTLTVERLPRSSEGQMIIGLFLGKHLAEIMFVPNVPHPELSQVVIPIGSTQ